MSPIVISDNFLWIYVDDGLYYKLEFDMSTNKLSRKRLQIVKYI